ncbi:hypothetical protein H2O64_14260 [Kordia sp. YSTF-M3]|uniref:Lipoprotein n=1 Tax=Kordia aestuariivivens TaxID=2759037 RepID=A0ABR7QB83_9FLAO|nr:hypothetical protein [Kordia aestuariivivens]MBC8755837.1 hypothetical protein [Kordia aestuariivivens]
MYRIIMLLVVFVFVISCKEEAKSSTTTKTTSTKTTPTETTKENEWSVTAVKKAEMSSNKEQLLSTTIAYFKNCKENSTNRNDCRNSITKMIAEFYKISDFKNDKGEYVVYDSIQSIVKKSDNWTKLGNASNQESLVKAQAAANNGNATIAIDISESYGQVAMIIPGDLTNSGSWKLQVPNTAALVNYDAKKSFTNKPLSYAFKSTENIVLFSKK